MKTISILIGVLLAASLTNAQTNQQIAKPIAATAPTAKPETAGASVTAAVPASEPVAESKNSQATNAPPSLTRQLVGVRPDRPVVQNAPDLIFAPVKPNEAKVGKRIVSGIAVQLVKAKNPLQLFNPTAPAEYGSGFDNIDYAPISGTGPLLKVFSISF
jgi:hypothetical protein